MSFPFLGVPASRHAHHSAYDVVQCKLLLYMKIKQRQGLGVTEQRIFFEFEAVARLNKPVEADFECKADDLQKHFPSKVACTWW